MTAKRTIIVLTLLALCVLLASCTSDSGTPDLTPVSEETEQERELKLYWFIPDGMRAEPDLFDIFTWAEEGKLPNIKRMMDQGSYGFSIPVYPSHTPVNFATLLTGTLPTKHGVADGPMHVEGKPLNKVSVGGFSSVAKWLEPVWLTLENAGKDVFLLSVPGSTPPELQKGTTVRGRWGGWGADFHATNFDEKNPLQYQQGRNARLFTFGPPLAEYVGSSEAGDDWSNPPESFSPAKEAELTHYGATVYAYMYDTTDNGVVDYDRVAFSLDRITVFAEVADGKWSDWHPITLTWKVGDEGKQIDTQFKIRVIKLDDDGFFRIRLFYNNLNEYITEPSTIAAELTKNVGPMVDFVDNFPPQLIYYTEDKEAFKDEMGMSFEWHTAAADYILKTYKPDIFIHDIYSPNQMLTSRWWMGYIDPQSSRYNDVTPEEREQLWDEIHDMYRKLDSIIGVMLDNADENTYVVLSSDHGANPLDKWVRVNNLFAQKGWLKFTINPETGEPIIDWENTTVIYLKMDNVYVCPTGLAGDWNRCSGEEYEQLREEVTTALESLEDSDTGINPVVAVVKWEDVGQYLDLPKERVGDLTIANEAGYGWNEEMTEDLELFSIPLKTGYKQAILPDGIKAMWTPFIIMGPGVKKGNFVEEPSYLQDQYPTIMHLLGIDTPHETDGRVLTKMLE